MKKGINRLCANLCIKMLDKLCEAYFKVNTDLFEKEKYGDIYF